MSALAVWYCMSVCSLSLWSVRHTKSICLPYITSFIFSHELKSKKHTAKDFSTWVLFLDVLEGIKTIEMLVPSAFHLSLLPGSNAAHSVPVVD